MTRRFSKLLTITAVLKTLEPLHVGSGAASLETDLPLARDGQNRLYLPGTSLAGPMRAWTEGAFPSRSTHVKELWGDADEVGASRILIEDAQVTLPAGADVEIWDHVGIDREWGASAKHVKYDREVLPAGTTFKLAMEVELGGTDDAISTHRAMVGHLILALQTRAIGFGAARSRGLGLVEIAHSRKITEEDWTNVPSLLRQRVGLDTPKEIEPTDLTTSNKAIVPAPGDFVDVTIEWEPSGPLMVKSAHEGKAIDMLPLLTRTPGGFAMLIPGSSLKGALRAQAERIVRTVRGIVNEWPEEGLARHRQQVAEPLVATLFGKARERADDDEDVSSADEPELGKSAVFVSQSSSTWAPPLGKWRALEAATKETLTNAIADLVTVSPAARLEPVMHVAIDRWTGGAKDSALFSAFEPADVSWTPIRLRVDLRRIPGMERVACLALLFLLIRDLCEGRISIGFGANRGYGTIRVSSAMTVVSDGSVASEYKWLNGQDLLKLEALDAMRVHEVEIGWQHWIDPAKPAPPPGQVTT